MEVSLSKSCRDSGMSNATVDSGYAGSLGSANGLALSDHVQMYGIMQKKPLGQHQSIKWARRFFVLKEGFLLYYPESEKKVFEAKRTFNVHPKAAIPLGNCIIEDLALPGMPYCINVHHPELKTQLCVAPDDEESRKTWIRAMDKATKVTTENTGLSETMIKSLQEQSLQLARERQEYVDKFVCEAEELGAERELREALEEFNRELEEENARIEGLVEELQAAHDEVKNELLQATESSRRLEREREEMRKKTEELHNNLEVLSSERTAIIQKLRDRESRERDPVEKNAELARQLAAIEENARHLEKDKESIRLKLEENKRMSKDLLQEREAISQEAEELKAEMQNLSEEKKLTEQELKEEILARMELQRELEDCKAALRRLETKALSNSLETQPQNNGANAVEQNRPDVDADNEDQIIRDVKSLRKFFESCTHDYKMDDKPVPVVKRTRQTGNIRTQDPVSPEPGPPNLEQNSSPVRALRRASLIRRKNQTARCKSMVFEDFSFSAMVRDPSHRRNLLLSRHKRSLSLSGQKKMTLPRNNEF